MGLPQCRRRHVAVPGGRGRRGSPGLLDSATLQYLFSARYKDRPQDIFFVEVHTIAWQYLPSSVLPLRGGPHPRGLGSRHLLRWDSRHPRCRLSRGSSFRGRGSFPEHLPRKPSHPRTRGAGSRTKPSSALSPTGLAPPGVVSSEDTVSHRAVTAKDVARTLNATRDRHLRARLQRPPDRHHTEGRGGRRFQDLTAGALISEAHSLCTTRTGGVRTSRTRPPRPVATRSSTTRWSTTREEW